MVDLGQQCSGFVFKLRALRVEIFFRIFAGAVFEVQIAQVLVELLFTLEQIIEARLLALAGEDVFRPEGVNEQRDQSAACRRVTP